MRPNILDQIARNNSNNQQAQPEGSVIDNIASRINQSNEGLEMEQLSGFIKPDTSIDLSPEKTLENEDITQGKSTSIVNSIKQAWDSTQQSAWQNQVDNGQDILDKNVDARRNLIKLMNSDPMNRDQYQSRLNELDEIDSKAANQVKSAQENVDINQKEIDSEYVSKLYKLNESLVNAKGANASIGEMMEYTLPSGVGSMGSMMAQQMAATFGKKGIDAIAKAAISGAAEGLYGGAAAEFTVPAVAVTTAITQAALLWNARAGETQSEMGDAAKQARQALTENWFKIHNPLQDPNGPQPSEEDMRQIRMQAMKGMDNLKAENMGLLVSDAAEMVLGSSLFEGSSMIKGLSRVGGYNKYTRLAKALGVAATGMTSERAEEGIQYAAGQRQLDTALKLHQYEDKGFMSNFLSDSEDTFKSINYAVPGFGNINLGGKYADDKDFQAAAEAGGLLGLLGASAGASARITKDVNTYLKTSKELKDLGIANTDEKAFRFKDSIYQKHFDNGTVNFLLEGIRNLRDQEDEVGNKLMSETDATKEIKNVSNAYDKYKEVNEHLNNVDPNGFLGIFQSPEQKAMLKSAKAELFHSAMEVTRHAKDLNVLESVENINNLIEHQEKIVSAIENTKDNSKLSKTYNLESRLKIAKAKLDQLNKSKKEILTSSGLEESELPEVSSVEQSNKNKEHLLNSLNLSDVKSRYNELLKIKDNKTLESWYNKNKKLETEKKNVIDNTPEAKTGGEEIVDDYADQEDQYYDETDQTPKVEKRDLNNGDKITVTHNGKEVEATVTGINRNIGGSIDNVDYEVESTMSKDGVTTQEEIDSRKGNVKWFGLKTKHDKVVETVDLSHDENVSAQPEYMYPDTKTTVNGKALENAKRDEIAAQHATKPMFDENGDVIPKLMSSAKVYETINNIILKGLDINNLITIDAVDFNGEKSVRIKIGDDILGYFRPGKYMSKEMSQLVDNIKIGDKLTNEQVKESGLVVNITNGLIKISKTESKLSELSNVVKTNSSYVILDNGTVEAKEEAEAAGRVNDPLMISSAGLDEGTKFDNSIVGKLGRYVLAFKDKSGNWKYLAIKPSKIGETKVGSFFKKLVSLSNKVVNDKVGIDENVDEINEDINKGLFIAIPAEQIKSVKKGPLYLSINISPKTGKLRVVLSNIETNKETGERVSTKLKEYQIDNDKIKDANTDQIINLINQGLLKTGVSISQDSFRNSVEKGELKGDFSNLFEAYVDPQVIYGQDITLSLNKPKADLNTVSDRNVKTAPVSDVEGEKSAEVVKKTKRSERVSKEIEETKEEEIKPIKLNDEEGVTKLSDKEADELIDSKELNDVKRIIPEGISIETKNDLRSFLKNIIKGKIPFGYFSNKVITLWTSAGAGTGYHEAFHSIFRYAISNKDVDRYLKIAEREVLAKLNTAEKLSNAMLDLRSSNMNYEYLTDSQIYDLLLEEHMADRFMEYKLGKNVEKMNAGLKQLFKRLLDLIKHYIGIGDTLEAFFDKIDRGAFSSTKAVANKQSFVANRVFKNLASGAQSSMESTKSKKIINTFSARVKQVSRQWDGKTEELPSNSEILDDLISKRIEALKTKGFDYLDSIEDNELGDRIEKSIKEELYTLENKSARALLKEQVNKKLKMFSVDKNANEEDVRDGENGETERWGSQESWTMSLEEGTNKMIREYIAFAMYETKDELTGENVLIAVDGPTIYNGLGHILANTDEDMLINKFIKYAKDNEQARAVLNMICSDTGMTIVNDKLVATPTKNFNDFRKIITAFKNVKITFLHTEFNPVYENGRLVSNKAVTYNANLNTAEKVSITNWANSLFNIKSLNTITPEYWAERVDKIVNLFNKSKNVQFSDSEINKQIEDLQKAFKEIGISLSTGYLRYSILSNSNSITMDQSDYLSAFEGIVPFNTDLLKISGKYSILNTLIDNRDLYGKGKPGDISSKMAVIAKANGSFDESLATSNFKGSDGNTRYDIIKSSYVLDETLRLRSKSYRDYIKEKYEILKDNVLLKNDSLLNNLVIDLIDGVRDHSRNDNQGTVFGDFSEREYLMQHLGYWFSQDKSSVNVLFRQNEASNTAYSAKMKVNNFISEDGSINAKGVNTIYSFFKAEYDRIAREKAKGNGNIKGYNDSDNGRAFRFTEFSGLAYTIGGEKYNALVNSARVGENISEDLEKEIKSALKKQFESQIDSFKTSLSDNKIAEFDKDGNISTNLIIPTEIDGNRLSNKDLTRQIEELYMNDYINSFSLNQLFDGDYALSRDDKGVKEVDIDGVKVLVPKQDISIDIVKRNKGAMGSGSDMGKGVHTVAFIKDINVFVEKGDGKLIRNKENKGDKINSNDAQSYTNINHFIFMSERLGRYSDDIKTILRKVRRGIEITNNEQGRLEDAQVSLNPWKTVTFGREFYIKTSEALISRHEVSSISDIEKYNSLMDELEKLEDESKLDRKELIRINKQLVKLYSPIKGKEDYHRILNQMDINGVDQVVAESASKGMTIDPQDSLSEDLDLSKSMIEIPNSYKRLQVETPTGKSVITSGTQLMQLIDSEQDDSIITSIKDSNGKNMNLGKLRSQYRSLMASSRNNSFNMAEKYIKKNADGSTDASRLKTKFLKALESSGADEQLLEIFQMNWNLLPAIDKAEQLFLAHFGSGVLAQKVPGTKVSLLSDANWNVVHDKNNNVVMNKHVKAGNLGTGVRKLLHNAIDPKTKKVYSECVLSERVFSKFGLKIGDEIPVDLATMLGYRIPTQDKHSMISLRVVDVLPNYMEGTGIFPAELVLLSGADFDIDSLFIQQPIFSMYNGVAIKAGKETNDAQKYESFKNYLLKDKLFKIELENRMSNDVDLKYLSSIKPSKRTRDQESNIEIVKKSLFESTSRHFGLPANEKEYAESLRKNIKLNNDVINNEILEVELEMLTNEGMKDIALSPVSSKPMESSAKMIQELKGISEDNVASSSSLLGKIKSFVQNSAGKKGIGPVANALQAFTFLAKNKISRSSENKLSVNGKELSEFKYKNSLGGRIAETLSTILSVMTDNAKDPIAGKMGISLKNLSAFNYLVSLGTSLDDAALIINTPSIQMYTKVLEEKDFGIKTASEQKGKITEKVENIFRQILGPDDKSTVSELIEKYSNSDINTLSLQDTIKNGLNDSNRDLNALMLVKYLQIEEEARSFQDLNNLIKLTKGLPTSFSDTDKGLFSSLENLGLTSMFGLTSKKASSPIINVIDAVENDSLLKSNIESAVKILKHSEGIFITETKAFKDQYDIVISNSRKGISNDQAKELKRSFLGYVTTKAYISWMKSRPTNAVADFNPSNDELIFPQLGGETFAKKLISLQNSKDRKISNNAFIRWLKPELKFDDKTGVTDKYSVIDKVSGKSFIKLSAESINDIVNAFQDLYVNKETRQFANDAFDYLIAKDNLEYKNDSFVKYIAPFMFENVSDGLDIRLNQLQNNLDQNGFEDSAKEFRLILASTKQTQDKFVKRLKGDDLGLKSFDSSNDAVSISGGKMSFNSVKNLNFITKLGFETKENEDVDLEFKFPEFLTVKIGKQTKLFYNDLNGQPENWSKIANYVEKPTFDFANVSTLSKTYNQIVDTFNSIRNKSVEKEGVYKGDENVAEKSEIGSASDIVSLDEKGVEAYKQNEVVETEKDLINLQEPEKIAILPKGLTKEDLDNIPECPGS